MVRRARPGERLETLDHVVRDLDPEDILITDDVRADLAGRHHGRRWPPRSRRDSSTDLVIEAAHFAPVAIARMARRHKLAPRRPTASSAASTRSCRCAPPRQRAVDLLVLLGGGTAVPGVHASRSRRPRRVTDHHGRPTTRTGWPGTAYGRETVCAGGCEQVGCEVDADDQAGTTLDRSPPPSLAARPDRPRTTSPRRSSGWRATRTCPVRAAARRRPGTG